MFSVVIPLYNKAYGIERALKSALDQRGNFIYEVIIINDGSTDGSDHIVNKLISDNVKVIHQENLGVSVARNIGIKYSKYEIICFLDADDWWELNYFSTLYDLIKDFPNESFFLMGFQKINNLSNKIIKINNEVKVFNNFGNSFLDTRGLVTPSIAVRKNVLLEMGLFPRGIKTSEDLFLWSKIIDKYNVVYSPNIVSNIYYELDNSRGGRNNQAPYILIYYSINLDKVKNIKGFLLYIYVAHIYQSIISSDTRGWYNRWKIGFKIFPLFSLFISFSVIFLIINRLIGKKH